ncbi:MAG: hypothetical protein Q9195_007667 [Heterodermia aff. obscurata]
MSMERAVAFCSQTQFAGRLVVAASNAPKSVTLSGDTDAVTEAQELCRQQGLFARKLKVDIAYHSPHMKLCAKPYLLSLQACKIKYKMPRSGCAWISSVHGFEMDISSDPLDDTYWQRNLLNPVLYMEALEQAVLEHGPFNTALEIGPHPVLKGPTTQIIQHLTQPSLPYCGLLKRGGCDVSAFSAALGFLWTELGSSVVDFPRYEATMRQQKETEPCLLKDLPSYPWDHEQIYWKESRISKEYRCRAEPPHELLGARIDGTSTEFRWRNILRLTEMPWLRGHKLQAEALFPAAGYCVMALEASRALWEGRAVRLLELENLEIHRAISLAEDSPGTEVVFSLTAAKNSLDQPLDENTTLLADFSCSAGKVDGTDSLRTIFTGVLRVQIGEVSADLLPARLHQETSRTPVDLDRFYSCLSGVGLDYTGSFRGLMSADRRLFEASATAVRIPTSLMVHPALLDMCFQAILVGYAAPGDESVWTPFLPKSLKRLRLSPTPSKHGDHRPEPETAIQIDAFVTRHKLPTRTQASSITGDVDMFSGNDDVPEIQVEGLECVALSRAKESDDRNLFSQAVWEVDIASGIVARDHQDPDSSQELALLEVCQRISYFYYRNTRDEISDEDVPEVHQPLFRFLDNILATILRGEHPVIKSEWIHDTREYISWLLDQYPNQIDVMLLRAVGENICSVIRGQSTMLEHMLKDSMLSQLYTTGIGFPRTNRYIARTARQIAHRYPNMDILEIGAGTGGTTQEILQALGPAFATYTFTDISAGFFHDAQARFRSWGTRMKFNTLDIEQDGLTQGFKNHSFDMVIASNVLHATRKLERTLNNVRRLLKPGGFLLLTEITGENLHIGFIMCGLPGWWLGVNDGRKYMPGISSTKWDALMRRTGFSGVDAIVHDFQDVSKHSLSVMVSQAVDTSIKLLRQPLEMAGQELIKEDLLIIGGKTPTVATLLQGFKGLMPNWKGNIKTINSLEQFDLPSLGPFRTVISLTDLDDPIFRSMTASTLKALQQLFYQCRNLFWVTEGCRAANPYCNMTVGLGRSVLSECPHLNIQFCDIDNQDHLTPKTLTQTFLQFLASIQSGIAMQDSQLWTIEPEIAIENGRLLIPRILPIQDMNDRLNTRRRYIGKNIAKIEVSQELMQNGNESTLNAMETHVQVRLTSCTLFAIRVVGNIYLYLCLGIILKDGQTVLAFSPSKEPVVTLPVSWLLPYAIPKSQEQQSLVLLACHLVAQQIPTSGSRGTILLHDVDDDLYSIISKKCLLSSEKVVRSTSRLVCSEPGEQIMFIHPLASHRIIKSLIPTETTAFIDLSKPAYTGATSVASGCLPPLCTHYDASYFFNRKPVHSDCVSGSLLQMTLQTLSEQLPEKFESELLTTNVFTIRPSETSSSSPSRPYLTLIDWEHEEVEDFQLTTLNPRTLFRGDVTYLLVGLTGELGESICRWMVSSGAKYLVIASRSPPKRMRWREELYKEGAKIIVQAVDVSDKQDLLRVYRSIGSRMPPIAGVANAAMVLSDAMFHDMTLDNLERVLKPKVDGSANLDDIFRTQDLDFFIMFSSLACIVGNRGQSNYAAANMFMTALAAQRRSRGVVGSVIDIGMVIGVGYVARTGKTYEEPLRRYNYMPISECELHAIFAEAILAGRPDSKYPCEIITGLQSSTTGMKPLWFNNPKFSHHHSGTEIESDIVQDTAKVSIKEQLASVKDLEEATRVLRSSFSAQLDVILHLPPGVVKLERPLIELGVDSLMAVEIRSWFLRETDTSIAVMKVLGGASAIDLCREVATAKYATKAAATETSVDVATLTPFRTPTEATAEAPSYNGSSGSEINGVTSQSPITAVDSTVDAATTSLPMQRIRRRRSLLTGHMERIESMSYEQSRLWFMMEYLEDPTTYNCTTCYKLHGRVDVARLKQAVFSTGQRHGSLRTTFSTDSENGEGIQGILESPRFVWTHRSVHDDAEVNREFSHLRSRIYDIRSGETMASG